MKRLVVPSILVVLLLLAMAFRWTPWRTLFTSSQSPNQVSYREDRWSGRRWVLLIGMAGPDNEKQLVALERPALRQVVAPEKVRETEQAIATTRDRWTQAWWGALLAAAVWLRIAVRQQRKVSRVEEPPA